MAEEKKKGLLGKALDAMSNRDEKEALEKAQKDAEAAKKEASFQKTVAAAEAKVAAERAAADKDAKTKADAEKAVAEKAAAAKAAADKATAEKWATQSTLRKGTVNVKSLRIRKDHSTDALMVGGLVFGEVVTILETWTDGKDTWAKIGNDQWAAMLYNKEIYIKENM